MYVQREIGQCRWRRLLRNLDERSRVHLRLFGRQVAFAVLFWAFTLLIDQHRPILFLSLMRTMFGLSALIVIGLAFFTDRPVSPTSLCIRDHALAMLLLTLLCSIVLRLLA
jgi:hypothetical protein